MEREVLERLEKYLKQFITFSDSARVGLILPQVFKSHGCEHNLEQTTKWLEAEEQNVTASLRWLKERGGDCDCKVITNVIWRIDEEL